MTICIYLYIVSIHLFIHLFIHLLPISIHLGNIYIHVFCDLWHGNFQDELVCSEGWSICTIGLLLTTDTIKTLAKLLNEVICFQECGNLRITREVGMSDVVWFYLSWEFARGFKYQSVIEHFDLNLCTLNVVGSVAASVDCHLLNDELWVVTLYLVILHQITRVYGF